MDYWRDGILRGMGYWIHDFQTLLAGLAAFATIFIILLHRKDDRLRKLWFAKGTANYAISELHKALGRNFEKLETDYIEFKNMARETHYEPVTTSLYESYSENHINTLANLIPVSKPKTASSIAECISFFQIYNSRLKSFEVNCADANFGTSLESFHSIMFNQIELSTWLMQRMLPYARSMKLYKLPDFKPYPDTSLLFRSKYAMHDPEYIKYTNNQIWPPSLPRRIQKWLARTT